MTSTSRITAVGVVIPAHDEEERIGACLRSVRRALERLPEEMATAVVVVLDRCSDRTPDRVEAAFEDWPGAVALRVAALGGRHSGASGPGPAHIVAGSGVGALRDLGVEEAMELLQGHDANATWLLHTDADTTVPVEWALEHLRYAESGVCGVAGMAELAAIDELAPEARRRYRAIVRAGIHATDREQHRHVYGANLGVRADAYFAVGGFPADGVGEDHGLWKALTAAGFPLVQPTGVRVRTSSRLRGRATGGLADLLLTLHGTPAGAEQPDTRDGA